MRFVGRALLLRLLEFRDIMFDDRTLLLSLLDFPVASALAPADFLKATIEVLAALKLASLLEKSLLFGCGRKFVRLEMDPSSDTSCSRRFEDFAVDDRVPCSPLFIRLWILPMMEPRFLGFCAG